MAELQSLADILRTGDGSEAHPFMVNDIAQEREVLNHLRKTRVLQSLVHLNGKPHDRLDCSDDTSVWFDVSQMPDWSGDIAY